MLMTETNISCPHWSPRFSSLGLPNHYNKQRTITISAMVTSGINECHIARISYHIEGNPTIPLVTANQGRICQSTISEHIRISTFSKDPPTLLREELLYSIVWEATVFCNSCILGHESTMIKEQCSSFQVSFQVDCAPKLSRALMAASSSCKSVADCWGRRMSNADAMGWSISCRSQATKGDVPREEM